MITTASRCGSAACRKRIRQRFAIVVATLLTCFPAVAEVSQASGQDVAPNPATTKEVEFAIVQGSEVVHTGDKKESQSSTVASLSMYERSQGTATSALSVPLITLNEDSIMAIAPMAEPRVEIDVTPLGQLFAPVVEAIAKNPRVDGSDLSEVSKYSLSATIVGTHHMVAKAIETWSNSRRMELHHATADDYLTYLTDAYHVMTAFADDRYEALSREKLREQLGTAEINEIHATTREREIFLAANTVSTLEAYKREFPEGKYVQEADRELGKARAEIEEATNTCLTKAGERRVRFRDCKECPVMAAIPTGSFAMGSAEHDREPANGENPQEGVLPRHAVNIGTPFAAGTYEVTHGQYIKYDGSNPSECWLYLKTDNDDWNSRWENVNEEAIVHFRKSLKDDHPATCISWNDAVKYAEWLTNKAFGTNALDFATPYRLLSEAEWEYVARAGTTTKFHYGDRLTEENSSYLTTGRMMECSDAIAVGREECGFRTVGKFEANKFGLHDVHGNVWEWVADSWNGDDKIQRTQEPIFDSDQALRVLRGGSWADEERYLRSAMRGRSLPHIRTDFTGFRVARDMDKCPVAASFSVKPEELRESDGSVVVTARLDAAQDKNTSIQLKLSGTAALGEDYSVSDEDLTLDIPAGKTEVTFTLTPINDAMAEHDETITVNATGSGLRVQATELILMDDDTAIVLSVDPVELSENADSTKVTVTATPVGEAATEMANMTIAIALSGVAVNGTDYFVTPDLPTIVIGADGGGHTTLTFEPLSDSAYEGVSEAILIGPRADDTQANRILIASLTLRESRSND